MSERDRPRPGPDDPKTERERRLAEALRRNLRRRKALSTPEEPR